MKSTKKIVDLTLKGVALAMGVAVVVLSVLKEMEPNTAIIMLGIGLFCLAVSQLDGKEK